MTTPFPSDRLVDWVAGASMLLLFSIRFPIIKVSLSGGKCSESCVLGSNPRLLFLKTELIIYRDPPEFVPE